MDAYRINEIGDYLDCSVLVVQSPLMTRLATILDICAVNKLFASSTFVVDLRSSYRVVQFSL